MFPGQETPIAMMNVPERMSNDPENQRAKTTREMKWSRDINVVENVLIRLKQVAAIEPSSEQVKEFKKVFTKHLKGTQELPETVTTANLVNFTFYYELSIILVKSYIFEIS